MQSLVPYLRAAVSDFLLALRPADEGSAATGLMAPEAYTLGAALEAPIEVLTAHEDREKIRQRAAQAYDKYQHCGLRAALRLFASGW